MVIESFWKFTSFLLITQVQDTTVVSHAPCPTPTRLHNRPCRSDFSPFPIYFLLCPLPNYSEPAQLAQAQQTPGSEFAASLDFGTLLPQSPFSGHYTTTLKPNVTTPPKASHQAEGVFQKACILTSLFFEISNFHLLTSAGWLVSPFLGTLCCCYHQQYQPRWLSGKGLFPT